MTPLSLLAGRTVQGLALVPCPAEPQVTGQVGYIFYFSNEQYVVVLKRTILTRYYGPQKNHLNQILFAF